MFSVEKEGKAQASGGWRIAGVGQVSARAGQFVTPFNASAARKDFRYSGTIAKAKQIYVSEN